MFLRKYFKFPGPKDLGMSNSNHAMPSRFFPNKKGEVSWEDYEDKLKELFPVRFFFAYTLIDFLHYKVWIPFWRPINDVWYWLKCHLIPEHRYHWLDLRQPGKNCDHYTHGWRDVSERILYANFNLLCEFVEKESHHYFCPSDKDIEETSEEYGEKASLINQRNNYREMMEIYNWWNFQRKFDARKKDELQHTWYEFHQKDPQSTETVQAWALLLPATEAFDAKENEMLIRLMKIRECLWT